MPKFKQSNVQIWFLDEDLETSARYLTGLALKKSLDGALCALVCARMYACGIRSRKAYGYYFSDERKDESMQKFFPGWPSKKLPLFKFYTSRASKWTRMCGEHYDYVRRYFEIMADELRHRTGRPDKIDRYVDWLASAERPNLPYANLKRISLPWKALKQKWRRRDIVQGYRLQFVNQMCQPDPFGAYADSPRDIPDFVIDHFGLRVAGTT